MVKDAPNHILMSMIGLAQTSREILKDSDILIFSVVLLLQNTYSLVFKPITAPYQDHIIHLLCGC